MSELFEKGRVVAVLWGYFRTLGGGFGVHLEIFPRTERGTGTAGTVLQEPDLSIKTLLEYRETLSPEEPSEPKTRTSPNGTLGPSFFYRNYLVGQEQASREGTSEDFSQTSNLRW